MKFLACDDVKLAYETAGDAGSQVLLIMGFSVPGRGWRYQIDALSKHHQVAWYDQRGSGLTRAKPGVYSMSLLASDAFRLMDHLGWQRAHVVGVSMGGMVAQRMALHAVHRVRSLALIATHAGGFRARLPTLAGAAHFVAANVGPRQARLRALAHLLFPDDFLASMGTSWAERVLAEDFGSPAPLRFRASQLAAVGGHDTRRRIGQLSEVPTLVVVPGSDLLVRPAVCRHLHTLIPGSRLLELPAIGHGVLRQGADPVNAALLDHFAQVDAARGRSGQESLQSSG